MFIPDSEPISSVVIAGASGFGLEVFDYLTAENGVPIAGFIDDSPGAALPSALESRILGSIADFEPAAGQVAVVAIGSVKWRQATLMRLWAKGVRTPSYLGPGAMVSPFSRIARGVMICPFSIVNSHALLGEGVVVNVHASVGHGASVGAFSVLSPYAALNGDSAVGERCFLGTRATIYPRVHIGDDCVVDSHPGVRMNAGSSQMIASRGQYLVTELRVIK